MPAIRVMRNNRGKRPKLDTKIKIFSEAYFKMELDSDEDYDIKTTDKHKSPATSKKGTAVKRLKKKGVPVSQNPRRNSTRVTNKYRLKYKAMFDPSIKEENIIFGTGADPGINAQECTNKALTTDPFNNTYEADEVSPEVEAGVVGGLKCLQP
jgi:hypothetical protein